MMTEATEPSKTDDDLSDREKYVRLFIEHTSIYSILNHRHNVAIGFLKKLRDAGIGRARQVAARAPVVGITGAEWELLFEWYTELEKEYARDYEVGKKYLSHSPKQFVEARMEYVRLKNLPFRKSFSDAVMRRIQDSGVVTMAQYKDAIGLDVPWQERWLLGEWQERLQAYFEKEYRTRKFVPISFAIDNVYKEMLSA